MHGRHIFFSFFCFSFNLSNTSPVNVDYTSEVTEDVGHAVHSEPPHVRTASRSSALVQVISFTQNLILLDIFTTLNTKFFLTFLLCFLENLVFLGIEIGLSPLHVMDISVF
jgi:hypothetical protein